MTHDPFPREPLTPEEQALARQLGELGPHGGPSPALDARILAAARAARSPMSRRTRRWPVALGVGASLVLAVGIAWRLRPLPGPAMEQVRVPPAPPVASRSAEVPVSPPPRDVFAAPPLPDAPATTPAATAEEAVAGAAKRAPRIGLPAEPVAPAPPEPPVVLAAPSPAPPPPTIALPAPPPPAAQAPAVRTLQAEPVAGAPAPSARKAAPPTAQAAEDATLDAAAAANAATGDEPPEDVPPATADAPAVRDAWLQRIRELLAGGQADAARASLKEFVRRNPDAPLPDDLRALAK
ncbi:MAG: hypothetical protein HOQ02_01920 [Lysobacter sp.]|nr:hypothetical protein [Lysobacter sp.]